MRLRAMIIMARPQPMTRATAKAWPFSRRKSRQSLRSRLESMASPIQTGGGSARFVFPNMVHPAIREVYHAVRHFRHHRVVGDQHGERIEFPVHALERLEDHHPGPHVQRS